LTDSEILALVSQQSVSPRLVFREQLQLAALYEVQRHTEFHSFVFQGGTALRLCYNNPRFSEDLDFVVRNSPPARISLDEPLPWENIVDTLTEVFPGATGFKVRVQKADSGIQRSIISCQTPYERGLHRLHLECVRVPAYTTAESIIQAPQGRFILTPNSILNLRMELARFLTREAIERFDAGRGWKRMLDGTLNLIPSIQHSIAPAPPTQRGPH